MSFSIYYHEIFLRMAGDLGTPDSIAEAAWTYAKRMWKATSIDWSSNHVIAYACISLATKMWADRETSYPICYVIKNMMRDVFREKLMAWEVRVGQALDWNLHYEHPVPPPPPK